MEIAEGSAFLLHDGGSLYVPPATIHKGWGESVSTHVVGDALKALPDQVMVTFYSYLEDKLYHGLFQLPFDVIAAHFATGYSDYTTGRHEWRKYETITVGVAPGGAVAVWLDGLGKCKEIFFGHAQELDRDFNQALQLPLHVNRNQRRESVLRQSATTDPLVTEAMKHIPLTQWDAYRVPYAWQLLFEGVPAPKTIASIRYYTGEYESRLWPFSRDGESEQRPIPSSLAFHVKLATDEYATKYVVKFNESEILRTFQRLGNDGRVVTLLLRQAERFDVIVRNEHEEIALVDFDYDLYETKRQ